MTIEGLKYIISHSEGTEIEYKKSQAGLARSVYETICAFLNRRGGHVVLGAKPPTNHLQQIVLGVLDSGEKGIVELMEACGYKDRGNFRKSVLNELISNKMIAMTHPENPKHRNQRYVKL